MTNRCIWFSTAPGEHAKWPKSNTPCYQQVLTNRCIYRSPPSSDFYICLGTSTLSEVCTTFLLFLTNHCHNFSAMCSFSFFNLRSRAGELFSGLLGLVIVGQRRWVGYILHWEWNSREFEPRSDWGGLCGAQDLQNDGRQLSATTNLSIVVPHCTKEDVHVATMLCVFVSCCCRQACIVFTSLRWLRWWCFILLL